MKNLLPAMAAALVALAAATGTCGDRHAAPPRYYGGIARRLCSMLPRYHVLQQPLDDEISRRAWTNLVTYYDFDHSIFLKSDLDMLAKRERALDDELRTGDVSFGYDVYDLFCRRLGERVDYATNLIAAAQWDFTSNETYRISRKDAPWPENEEDARELWRKRIKNEKLAMMCVREIDKAKKAAEKKDAGEKDAGETGEEEDEIDPALTDEENLVKKYRQYLAILTEPDEEAILQHYLSAVTRAYDPHSDYMSPADKEDFDMDMNLTLCGVGAVLQMDDGALKIAEIMPGGPVDLDGRIETGDKIIGVKQEDGEMEDIMWQPMKKSVRKIRGKKGTRVTLEIIPRSDSTGATKKLVELVRDEIKLEDQAATGHVEKVTLNGVERKLGYVYLPGFYGSMDKKPGEEGYRSSADDVAKFLADFNAQDVDGVILDLRGDGGGSLKEAARLSELFVPSGPVVLIRDTRAAMPLTLPSRRTCACMKPLIVMIDRASASASEIVAGHLRDTGRAIIVGDCRSHGKGTVQTVMGMGPEKYGSMKITTARFYRINGRSTQVKGVESDIHLPSLIDSLDIGEDKLTYALPFTRIRKLEYPQAWDMPKYLPELKARSEKRVAESEPLKAHFAKVAGWKEIYERKEVPLEMSARRAMIEKDKALDEKPGEEAAADKDGKGKKDKQEKKPRRRRARTIPSASDDPVLEETYRILADLAELAAGDEMPQGRVEWYNSVFGM